MFFCRFPKSNTMISEPEWDYRNIFEAMGPMEEKARSMNKVGFDQKLEEKFGNCNIQLIF